LDVCRSEWGKHLGGGLAEFRLRHDEREVLSGHGSSDAGDLPEASPEKVLLRVFFHAHGNRLILLLSGYDKGGRSGPRHQKREIERARAYLKEWQAEQARRRHASERGLGNPTRMTIEALAAVLGARLELVRNGARTADEQSIPSAA
jgi:hypothetical protein